MWVVASRNVPWARNRNNTRKAKPQLTISAANPNLPTAARRPALLPMPEVGGAMRKVLSSRVLYPVAALSVLAMLVRRPLFGVPLDPDEGGYAYVAHRWATGRRPLRQPMDRPSAGPDDRLPCGDRRVVHRRCASYGRGARGRRPHPRCCGCWLGGWRPPRCDHRRDHRRGRWRRVVHRGLRAGRRTARFGYRHVRGRACPVVEPGEAREALAVRRRRRLRSSAADEAVDA